MFALNKDIKIINAYGPTEATCSMTYADINYKNIFNNNTDIVSIGKCIPGMEIKLDNTFKQNKKRIGEILISGKQLSIGYFRQKKLTKQKFVKFDKKLFYRTGDLGFKINNQLYFYSREDNQIKINGFRVELSEIDYYIRKSGAVKSISANINGKIVSFVILGNIDNKK